MSTPPRKELKTNFKIFLIGIIKILPITNNIHMQDITIRTFIFTQSPQQKIVAYITTIFMFQFGQIFTHPAILFFLYSLTFSSSNLLSSIPFLLAILIR